MYGPLLWTDRPTDRAALRHIHTHTYVPRSVWTVRALTLVYRHLLLGAPQVGVLHPLQRRQRHQVAEGVQPLRSHQRFRVVAHVERGRVAPP